MSLVITSNQISSTSIKQGQFQSAYSWSNHLNQPLKIKPNSEVAVHEQIKFYRLTIKQLFSSILDCQIVHQKLKSLSIKKTEMLPLALQNASKGNIFIVFASRIK